MRPLNDALATQILEAGKAEFFEKGFQKASVRSIAAAVGVTTGALYRYYANKDALFEALVQEPAEAFYRRYRDYSEAYSERELEGQLDGLDEVATDEMGRMMAYIYAHYDAFKLIACCAEGTRYADYRDRLIEVETKSSIALVRLMQKERQACTDIDEQMVHIIASIYFTGIFEVIAHDSDQDIAMRHLGVLRDFYTAGWYKILGIV